MRQQPRGHVGQHSKELIRSECSPDPRIGAVPDIAAAVVRSSCIKHESIDDRNSGSRVTFSPRYRTEDRNARSSFSFACDQLERLLDACV